MGKGLGMVFVFSGRFGLCVHIHVLKEALEAAALRSLPSKALRPESSTKFRAVSSAQPQARGAPLRPQPSFEHPTHSHKKSFEHLDPARSETQAHPPWGPSAAQSFEQFRAVRVGFGS